MNKSDLAVPEDGLPGLASDLSEMQSYLATQAKRMATIVDAIESGWRSPAASTYTEFQQSVAEDLVRIKSSLQLLEEAVRMSSDGFTAQELDNLRGFQRVQGTLDIAVEANELTRTDSGSSASPSPSKILDL
ncbi:WXG100 family type VII secretion target [Streptomyces sp. 71268]|uniref:WXG100 family type VII secretion target n=1 Tax=Streptomyces sp. 71268 TaxID=3002640 RepID=UPI0023F7EE01|nr:WXG100 family type VII secretion target [Streptomyces sp. 71268]WEV25941.1 WXG100 family type VII secretion target [Streptomyces sp. 71268]